MSGPTTGDLLFWDVAHHASNDLSEWASPPVEASPVQSFGLDSAPWFAGQTHPSVFQNGDVVAVSLDVNAGAGALRIDQASGAVSSFISAASMWASLPTILRTVERAQMDTTGRIVALLRNTSGSDDKRVYARRFLPDGSIDLTTLLFTQTGGSFFISPNFASAIDPAGRYVYVVWDNGLDPGSGGLWEVHQYDLDAGGADTLLGSAPSCVTGTQALGLGVDASGNVYLAYPVSTATFNSGGGFWQYSYDYRIKKIGGSETTIHSYSDGVGASEFGGNALKGFGAQLTFDGDHGLWGWFYDNFNPASPSSQQTLWFDLSASAATLRDWSADSTTGIGASVIWTYAGVATFPVVPVVARFNSADESLAFSKRTSP